MLVGISYWSIKRLLKVDYGHCGLCIAKDWLQGRITELCFHNIYIRFLSTVEQFARYATSSEGSCLYLKKHYRHTLATNSTEPENQWALSMA